ncbi:olfactory receptor 1L4-like isoform X2 [Rhineura floridana]|uniref:olfactory receptor 1L4-like isoform X2 n=1 Tax=Rhineura floridana TaxID=261503 RepID=UPI002AC7FAFA|nr:olfactory receptor 1L4-like isoform X2 [Rhineura floridana]
MLPNTSCWKPQEGDHNIRTCRTSGLTAFVSSNLKNTMAWALTDCSSLELLGICSLGLISNQPGYECLLAPTFLSMYLLTLLGNLLILLLIHYDARLYSSPMYFFLGHLSLADMGFSSSTVPKMLQNLLTHTKHISYGGCLAQMFFFLGFGNTESFLLASMAYDRYVAICRPLRYAVLMNPKHCLLLAVGCWFLGFLHSLLYTLMMSCLSFCASREIPHFFCDLHPLIKLSCSDTSAIQMTTLTEGTVTMVGPFTVTLLSYIFIFSRVLKIPSTAGKRKAFSTCGSHLTTVILFFGTVIAVYVRPSSTYSGANVRIMSVAYTAVTPMLNPFIYSLRNSEIQQSLRKCVGTKWGR